MLQLIVPDIEDCSAKVLNRAGCIRSQQFQVLQGVINDLAIHQIDITLPSCKIFKSAGQKIEHVPPLFYL